MHEKCARLRRLLASLFCAVIIVGDRSRALCPGEIDPDAAELVRLNRVWRKMLATDPWMTKLRSHVHLLGCVSLVLSVLLLIGITVAPADVPFPSLILLVCAVTVPYWFWIARWRARIEQRVFLQFTKRFGKHYHLH